eukprot:6197764-Pleurochrysis_carterae.AAC.2
MGTGRQRGYYSEILEPELAAAVAPAAADGPRQAMQPRLGAPKQALPPAKLLGSETRMVYPLSPSKPRAASLSSPLRSLHKSPLPAKTTGNFKADAPQPKVLVPFHQEPGAMPRKVVIERQRRLYTEQDIEQLLLDEGVDITVPELQGDLPLEMFDDTEFDSRLMSEWEELVHAGDLTGRFLHRDADGEGSWRECKVLKFDAATQLFTVLDVPNLNDDEDAAPFEASVRRIDVCFSVENPMHFAKRVAAAHRARQRAADLMRFNLFIDCMPHDGMPTLEKERANSEARRMRRVIAKHQLALCMHGDTRVPTDCSSAHGLPASSMWCSDVATARNLHACA